MKTVVKTVTKAVKAVKRGRPSTIGNIVRKNIVHLTHRTPKEFVASIFEECRPMMKGGLSDDPSIIKAQSTTIYQTVLKEQRKALAAGKKVAFKGRVVAGVKKTKWIHATKKEIEAAPLN